MAVAGMRALEHRGVCGAGIEPDFQDVVALGVGLGILRADDGGLYSDQYITVNVTR